MHVRVFQLRVELVEIESNGTPVSSWEATEAESTSRLRKAPAVTEAMRDLAQWVARPLPRASKRSA